MSILQKPEMSLLTTGLLDLCWGTNVMGCASAMQACAFSARPMVYVKLH